MKPDWKDAPEWANYLAMDKDGEWYWFSSEPKLIEDCGVYAKTGGKSAFAGKTDPLPLMERPK